MSAHADASHVKIDVDHYFVSTFLRCFRAKPGHILTKREVRAILHGPLFRSKYTPGKVNLPAPTLAALMGTIPGVRPAASTQPLHVAASQGTTPWSFVLDEPSEASPSSAQPCDDLFQHCWALKSADEFRASCPAKWDTIHSTHKQQLDQLTELEMEKARKSGARYMQEVPRSIVTYHEERRSVLSRLQEEQARTLQQFLALNQVIADAFTGSNKPSHSKFEFNPAATKAMIEKLRKRNGIVDEQIKLLLKGEHVSVVLKHGRFGPPGVATPSEQVSALAPDSDESAPDFSDPNEMNDDSARIGDAKASDLSQDPTNADSKEHERKDLGARQDEDSGRDAAAGEGQGFNIDDMQNSLASMQITSSAPSLKRIASQEFDEEIQDDPERCPSPSKRRSVSSQGDVGPPGQAQTEEVDAQSEG